LLTLYLNEKLQHAWICWRSPSNIKFFVCVKIKQLKQDKKLTPKAIAVTPVYRGLNIGTFLLEQTLLWAADRFPAVSLSVRANNPVLRLYEGSRFVKVPESETINHAGGSSFKMIRKFN